MNRHIIKEKYDPERKIASKFGSKPLFSSRQTKQEQFNFDSRFDDEREQRQSYSQDRCGHSFRNEKKITLESQNLESQRLNFGSSHISEFKKSNAKCILRSKFATESEVPNQMNEDAFCESIMEERATEMLEIHKKMHKVNDIYKDLATLISDQQVLIDEIDKNIDDANAYTKDGVEEIDQARQAYENPILVDPFGDKLKPRDRRKIKAQEFTHERDRECFTLCGPLSKLKEDVTVVMNDIKAVFLTCTAPNV